MKVYVFGNRNSSLDNRVFKVLEKIKKNIENLKVIEVQPNADLPFSNKQDAVILDTVQGIEKIEILKNNDLDKLVLSESTTAHDFDLGFQLKYLQKLGKLGKITIIGIPQVGEIDYFLIQSTLRKLVAQDIQGS